MAKFKRSTVFMSMFIAAFFGINIFLYRSDRSPLSGLFVGNLPAGINFSLVAFIVQWIILLLIVLLAYTRFLKHRKEEETKIRGFIIPSSLSKSETYLDVLYKLLKEKKSLSVGIISKVFKIPKDKALEWAKMLENDELVTIEYPAFADPEIKIMQNEEKKE
ncbi:MAG: hypothetical protein AABW50_02635 [Nanoarchaeota archaeon]|mgnify:CR=1 FL=1